jgi:hypothetical protein
MVTYIATYLQHLSQIAILFLAYLVSTDELVEAQMGWNILKRSLG